MSRLPMSLLLLAVLTALVALPAGASASSKQVMTFEAPRELLRDADRERTLDEIKALGVDRVRVLMYWSSIAPAPDSATKPAFDASDPAAYPQDNWARYDALMRDARSRGIEVYVTLTGSAPRWATKAKRDNLTRPSAKEFEAFATAAGRRYGEQVAIWSIWNEPNQPQFLLPQFSRGKAVSPGIYRALYQGAQRGLRASGNGGDTILLGETSPRGNRRVVAPLAFLRGTLCLSRSYKKSRRCGRLDTDGYAHHPYTTSSGPRFRPPNPDDVTIGVLSRLTRALDRAGRARAVPRGLGVYLTEFGIQSRPDPIAVSLAQQAEYLAISERLAYLNKRVRTFSQYLMADDDPDAGGGRFGGFESGLRLADGRAKPAYDAFRTPLAVTDYGRSDVVWGLIRPVRGQPTRAVVQYRNPGAKAYRDLRPVQTNARGTFGFRTSSRSGRRYRIQWTAPDGTVFTGPPVRAYKR